MIQKAYTNLINWLVKFYQPAYTNLLNPGEAGFLKSYHFLAPLAHKGCSPGFPVLTNTGVCIYIYIIPESTGGVSV